MPRVPARASGYSSSPNHCPGQVEAGEEEQTHSRKGGKERNNMDGERKRERVKEKESGKGMNRESKREDIREGATWGLGQGGL